MIVGSTTDRKGQTLFRVWAPNAGGVDLLVSSPSEQSWPMKRSDEGYWEHRIDGLTGGTRYKYRLDGSITRPDPASHFQPEGVHEASQIVDHHSFRWRDKGWKGIPLESYVLYELHVGTFTPEGTFSAIIPRLNELRGLGVTAIELMPVAQFPGTRNWGYDGTYPYAVQSSYGGPEGLKELVNACHLHGLAVVLDVVYNHLGPEGNYLADFGPYFTDRYRTPWGKAINFDGPDSNHVRNYFIQNALFWFREYHIDALRLDAIEAITDMSAQPFLQQLSEETDRFNAEFKRRCFLMAESDLNDAKVIRKRELGGFGIHAQWSDDFHHAVHTLLTGESKGYYRDYGTIPHLIKAIEEGFIYTGQYSANRRRSHGNSSAGFPAGQFITCIQNHDQVGNRKFGERLSTLVPFEALKLAAAVHLLTPSLPLLFMGEEYGESSPFLFFVDHGDADLVEAVRRGRKEEFREFEWDEDPPDPYDPKTFLRSKINWEQQSEGSHRTLIELYRRLFKLRSSIPALKQITREQLSVSNPRSSRLVVVDRTWRRSRAVAFLNFGEEITTQIQAGRGTWIKKLDTASDEWEGPGSAAPATTTTGRRLRVPALSALLYVRK